MIPIDFQRATTAVDNSWHICNHPEGHPFYIFTLIFKYIYSFLATWREQSPAKSAMCNKISNSMEEESLENYKQGCSGCFTSEAAVASPVIKPWTNWMKRLLLQPQSHAARSCHLQIWHISQATKWTGWHDVTGLPAYRYQPTWKLHRYH